MPLPRIEGKISTNAVNGDSYRRERKERAAMPTISMFYGLIIRMYYAPGEHPPPHFHAYYNEFKATFDIRSCEMIEGNLPKKQTKLVLAWAELHQDELMANWTLLMNGEEPFKIQPLQ
nr:DUF4160 domain-containing protein [Geoalkalibacter sp.]